MNNEEYQRKIYRFVPIIPGNFKILPNQQVDK